MAFHNDPSDSSAQPHPLTPTGYLLESGQPLDLAAARAASGWQAQEKPLLVLANGPGAVWIHLHPSWPEPLAQDWILNLRWHLLQQLDVYVLDSASGDLLASYPRATDFNGLDAFPYAFPLNAAGHQRLDIYLRINAPEKLTLPLMLWPQDLYESHMQQRNLLLGLYLGALAIMLLYNLSLFLLVKVNSYGWYCLYVLSILFYTIGVNGVGNAFLWGFNDWLQPRAYGLFASTPFLFAVLFLRSFLELGRAYGWLRWSNTLVAWFWALVLVGHVWFPGGAMVLITDAGALLSCLFGLLVAVVVWRQGNRSGKYVVLAWGLLMVATTVLFLGLTNLIPYRLWYMDLQNVGVLLEMLVLSVALAERINRERDDKRLAQELSLTYYRRAREAQHQALEIERQAKQRLEDEVDCRTRELRDALTELEVVNKELNFRSKMDGLTGLANRSYFDQAIEKEILTFRRTGRPLSLIMGDLDHFKGLNDHYGHLAGDACLMMVAAIWEAVILPEGGMVARYGGEEIIAIMPATDISHAMYLAEQIRARIEAQPCYSNDQQISVTISLGVAQAANQQTSPELLIQQVDESLYEAKAAGRNCVVANYIALERQADWSAN
ncbi:sensor domain-containing diguanylate cyclase [Oceanobacter mangrovi]|uniref:sensor domain-containing diguanylate cyclase n=1 Tax=Oceanobacter mangrovi TaxID=2862510 RepID=UPI001C8EEF58|nr:diguanylate cyclase [Oceanobacter mangrovi]